MLLDSLHYESFVSGIAKWNYSNTFSMPPGIRYSNKTSIQITVIFVIRNALVLALVEVDLVRETRGHEDFCHTLQSNMTFPAAVSTNLSGNTVLDRITTIHPDIFPLCLCHSISSSDHFQISAVLVICFPSSDKSFVKTKQIKINA